MKDTRYHLTPASTERDVSDELAVLDRRVGSALRKAFVGLIATVIISVGSALLMGARWQEATDQRLVQQTRRVEQLEQRASSLGQQTSEVSRSIARLGAQINALQHELTATRQDVRDLRAALASRRRR